MGVIFLRDMKKLIQIIKQAAIDVYESRKPCDVFYGKVVNINPAEVLYNGMTLPSELLVFVNGVKKSVCVGNRVALLRKAGGQKYIVLGVIDT